MSAWLSIALGEDMGELMRRANATTPIRTPTRPPGRPPQAAPQGYAAYIPNYKNYIPQYDPITWLGIGLAIFANLLIAVSLNIQKYAHMQNTQRVARGEERLPYHKIPVWWLGMVFNAVGEVGNLVAYGYAEATVVTPIGAVGVIFSGVIATFVLKEKFMRIHAAGILLIACGVILIVYAKGNEKVIEPTVEEALHDYFLTTQSIVYFVFITIAGGGLHVVCEKYGDKYVILYTSLCSLIAAWTVLGSKAFMAFFRLTVEKGQDQLTRFPAAFFAWAMLLVIIVAAVASLHFLQCAMIYHENNIVIPTYYATFTLSCIIGAAVVYREFEGLAFGNIMLFFVGVSLAGVGVYIVSFQEKKANQDSVGGEGDVDEGDDEEASGGQRIKRIKQGESRRLVEMDHLAKNAHDDDSPQAKSKAPNGARH